MKSVYARILRAYTLCYHAEKRDRPITRSGNWLSPSRQRKAMPTLRNSRKQLHAARSTVIVQMLALAATCWGDQPASGPQTRQAVAQATVDPETIHLPVVEARDIRFVRLKRSQGLSSQRVTSMAQDGHGFLWFGTDYGVDRYDGYRFRVFASQRDERGNPPYIAESTLFVDRSGTLWIGSVYGLGRYDPDSESFVHYRLARGADSESWVHHITQDRAGTLWLSTERGLYRLDPTSGKTIRYTHDNADGSSLSSDEIRSSGEDREGALWVATSEGLDEFDREHGRVTLHVPLPEKRDFGVYEDRAGVLWVRYASGNGLAILNRATRHLTRFSFGRKDLPTHPLTGVSSILEDQDGTLWVGTFSDGLLKYDRVHQRFVRYRNDPANDESLTEDRITTLLQDREKNIWVGFGATEPAFFATRAAAFEVLPFDSSNSDNLGEALVNAIYEDRAGMVWMGTTGALVRLDRKTGRLTHVAVPDHTNASDVLSIVEDAAGALWIGTSGQGLYRRLPGSERLTAFRHSDTDPASLSDDTVMRLMIDRAGTLWVGTMNGLDRFNPDTQNFTTFRHNDEAEPNMFEDIVEDSHGALWVGGFVAGARRFDPGSGSFTPLVHAERRGVSMRAWIRGLLIDHGGSIWVSSLNGLDEFDPRSGRLAHYSQKDGLPSNAVNCVLEDSSGDLWLGTGAGVSHFSPRRRVFTNYTQADGLPGVDFIGWHACFRSDSGEMFMGGFSGAVAFRPEKVATATAFVPSVALTSFQLFGKPLTPGSGSILKRAIDYTEQLTLTHDQNSFAFEFAALSFTNPMSNRYRYKLEGLDRSWHEVGSDQRYAAYTTLPPGTYNFRLQGATVRGPWSEPGLAVRINIKPAWWNTWWFRGLTGILLIATAVALYLLRVRQISRQFAIRLEERVSERTRIARELHDSLLQGVQGLMIRLYAVRELLPARPTDAAHALGGALQCGDQAIAEGRAAVQDLRATTLASSDLAEALMALGPELLPEGRAQQPSYHVLVEGIRRPLMPLVRDDTYRIAREAVRNAVQHARARRLEVELVFGEQSFSLRVRDDGIGVDAAVLEAARRGGHWGLQGMHERAKSFGAHLEMWSEHGAGTELLLEIPATVAYGRGATRAPAGTRHTE